MWDERYAEPGLAYGSEPNEFLVEALSDIEPCRALCVGAGEGRNAVFLAELGFDVTALDRSTVGLAKAEEMAAERGVSIQTIERDLANAELATGAYTLIVSIFAHVPPDIRARVHSQVRRALRPGGAFVLEAYTPAQVGRGTGGPPVESMTMTAKTLRRELEGLQFHHLLELERSVVEGRYHTGIASVVQLIARRSELPGKV